MLFIIKLTTLSLAQYDVLSVVYPYALNNSRVPLRRAEPVLFVNNKTTFDSTLLSIFKVEFWTHFETHFELNWKRHFPTMADANPPAETPVAEQRM